MGPPATDQRPVLHPGVYAFCSLPPGLLPADLPALAIFHESEGTTVILEESIALSFGLRPAFRAAWLTLTAPTDLHSVGLTAAVSGRLAEAGIACNVVAAVHHDHLFVPADRGREALELLLQ